MDLEKLRQRGEDVFIDKTANITRPELVSVGSHVAIDFCCHITTAVEAGDYLHIAAMTSVIGGKHGLCRIGHFCGLATGSRVVCASEEYLGRGMVGPTIPEEFHDRIICDPVTIEDFVTIGANVVVMPGITLGEGSIVGAGSVVTKDTEPWTISVGVPARPIKERPRDTILRYARKMGYRD